MTTTEPKFVYLDNAATTQVDRIVFDRMRAFFTEEYGNPSSPHLLGHYAREAVEKARYNIAHCLGCSPDEIVFTSGGTEANNLAIQGAALSLQTKGNHIITSQVEHASVLEVCSALEKIGFVVTYLPVDKEGVVSLSDLREAITPRTILISLMHANNETGTLQPIHNFAAVAQERGILFHTDAVQSFKKVPLDLTRVHLCSLSAHKIHGPKGVGALYVQKGVPLTPQQFGGGQEKTYRAGTENVPGIVGFGEAVVSPLPLERMREQKKKIIHSLRTFPGVVFNGSQEQSLPNIVNVSFAGVDAETLLEHLNHAGVMVSKGSACHSHDLQPSHVLLAMGVPRELALGAIRITISKNTTDEELEYALSTLFSCVSSLRSITRWKQ